MSSDIADAVLALPPYAGISYRGLRPQDGLPPTLFMSTRAMPTTRDVRVAAGVDGVSAVVVFLNRTARDVSPVLEGGSGEVALMPGAAYHAVGRTRDEASGLDVLAVEELLHEGTQAPAPDWPFEGAKIAELVSEALATPWPEGRRAPDAVEAGRYVGPMPVVAAPRPGGGTEAGDQG
ncbi:hypothetical protein [Cellulomonas sp. PhB143]|uniref:hypothetical protein n=1 Tax=Cellulomonas sp. PhB143 TaxID=2485186 RepID=UPI000F4A4B66|nr:hypothetical protein [Cellulomonas sp. PhB143]ROS79088.1 hypothetical protein EDF32_0134 [Cellulomonas sp. PhB143]